MTPRPIIIDTDPGQDDAVAILLALASPEELEVRAITTVAGNVPLALTTVNALKMVELAGRTEVPVYAGCDGPLHGALITAEYVHGRSGLDGATLPEPVTAVAAGHAVDAIVEIVTSAPPGTITLCPLGPLTNVATALDREPRMAAMLREIVLMGGGFFEGGNTTPTAEFNIYVDPEAADVVFRCGAPITVLPLDVTHRALILPRHLERFAALGTRVGEAVHGLLTFYERYDVAKYGMAGGPLHDPCVIAYLLKPELFRGKLVGVEIETESPLTRGMTVVDWWGMTSGPRNATWIREVDAEGFFDLLVGRLAAIG
ncbi:MAG: nucleoside hydrolase [Actinobacteria bacterium RBG_16_68_21]|nr:MAG: nucleoside hydrolase [Actinobacteria bacterium RBG_16_68_21]